MTRSGTEATRKEEETARMALSPGSRRTATPPG
jgi:hypothetical protein